MLFKIPKIVVCNLYRFGRVKEFTTNFVRLSTVRSWPRTALCALAMSLRSHGHVVFTAQNGLAALRAAIDIHLPSAPRKALFACRIASRVAGESANALSMTKSCIYRDTGRRDSDTLAQGVLAEAASRRMRVPSRLL